MTQTRVKHKYLICALIFVSGLGLALSLSWMAKAQAQAADNNTVDRFNTPEAKRYYVAKSGNGLGGQDWTNAFTNVQQALGSAISGDEIWVATGVYTPGINQTDSFNLVPGVSLYGGFKPGDTQFSDRDWENNLTVLSGDIDGNDTTNANGVVADPANIKGANAYHVVYASGLKSSAVLDGFIICAGKANGENVHSYGGGFYCDGYNSGNTCSPSLKNIVFSGNSAVWYGGAMYNDGTEGGESSPSLTNVSFSTNSSENYAGGLYNDGSQNGTSSPTLTWVTFSGNFSENLGGAMYNDASYSGTSSPDLTNVIFSGNSAGIVGGAMYNDGSQGGTSRPVLQNIAFSGNYAGYVGGAIYNDGSHGGTSRTSLTNVTLAGNSAGEYGGAIFNFGVKGACSVEARNSILWNNQDSSGKGTISATAYNDHTNIKFSHSLAQGAGASGSSTWTSDANFVDGGGNIDTNPMFITPVNPSSAPTTTGNLHLQSISPAINAGNKDFVTAAKDLEGNDRIVGCDVDMGAYETVGDFPCRIFEPLILR